jgi:hypothetical protein
MQFVTGCRDKYNVANNFLISSSRLTYDSFPNLFLSGGDGFLNIINEKSLEFFEASAEREGFEPPEVLPSTVFKTAAFDRSAISPAQI